MGSIVGVGALVALLGAVLVGRGARAAAPAPLLSAGGEVTPVVLELFTSEGCSSCPSADAVLNRFALGGGVPGARVVPLAFHVDYWNDLGWPDPFSSGRYTARQRVYSAALGQSGVYTPEAIVDGAVYFVGSDGDRTLSEVARAAKRPHAKVTLGRASATARDVVVSVGALPLASPGDAAEVWLAVTEDGLVVDVPRGENGGRRLPHDGVVRDIVKLGNVATSGATLRGAAPESTATGPAGRKHLVALVQERTSRRILGAAVLDL